MTKIPEYDTTKTGLFIDGVDRSTSETMTVWDPAMPDQPVGYASAATAADAADAINAGRRAFPGWAALTPRDRARALLAALEHLGEDSERDAEILTLENGKITAESRIDVTTFRRRFESALDLVDEVESTTMLSGPPYETSVSYRPVGVVSIIVPYNWPLAILACSLPFALLAGNTVVVKPPPSAPLAVTRVVARMAAHLPPGVLNVVSGRDADVGETLVTARDVAMISFTGSSAGGANILRMASTGPKKVVLELGGNDPALILEDARLDDDAFDRLFHGAYRSTGQICMAIKRVHVHRSRFEEVVEGLSARLEKVVLGHGLDGASTMGPLHTARQKQFVDDLVAEARASGATVREFGTLPAAAALRNGYFTRPSLVLDPDPSLRIVTEEQFGPTLPILPFDDVDAAVSAANDTWSGLCASVWSDNPERAAGVADRLDVGYVFINGHGPAWVDHRAPFGGVKGSGYGREMGVEGLREFMATRSISSARMD